MLRINGGCKIIDCGSIVIFCIKEDINCHGDCRKSQVIDFIENYFVKIGAIAVSTF